MKFYMFLLLVHYSWFNSGQAMYHERSMTTITLPNPKENSSYFGFSITYAAATKRLIVGAPRGSDIGLLFSCDIDNQNCTNIPVDIHRHDEKYRHDYWLGAAVKSHGKYIYTCAPRSVQENHFRWHVETLSKGECYRIADSNGNHIIEKIHSLNHNDGYHSDFRQSLAHGWSIDISGNESLLIGSPVVTGVVNAILNTARFPKVQKIYFVPNAYNFGYSIAVSNFMNASKRNIGFAVGAPYGEIGYGTVLIYDIRTTRNASANYQLKSNEVGSMFGAVLCAAHIAGSKHPAALLVGAPTHTEGLNYDVGEVYVYLKIKQVRVIKGKIIGARFGLAIASVGDLDGDNRDEVAIAAPYEKDGRGAVYVYSGATLMDNQASLITLQRLEPLPGSDTHGFGLALASLPDYHQDGCNELAIGAPYSDSVSLLRCFAAVTLEVYAEFPDLKDHNTPNFEFRSCINISYPEKPEHILESVNITLRLKHSDAKLTDTADLEYTVTLNDKSETIICRRVQVATPPDGDYSKPIEWKISAVHLDSPLELEEFNSSRVLISERSVIADSGVFWIPECSIVVCVPKLALEIFTHVRMNESTNSERFSVVVSNTGDTALDVCVRLLINDDATLVPDSKTNCSHTGAIFTCKPPKALRNNNSWQLKDFTFDTTTMRNNDTETTILVEMYPRCHDNDKTEYVLKFQKRM